MSDEEYRIQPDLRTCRMGMHIELMGPFVDLVMETDTAMIHLPMDPALARSLARDLIRSARRAEEWDRGSEDD